jgi:CubicO group peptidase (beta-lactamase class C family)
MTDNFFKPLQMEHTFVFDTTMIGKALPSYDWRGVEIPFNYLDAVYGDKNIYSTPYDLLLWDRLLNTNLVFAAQTLEEAYRPYSHEHAGIRNYGLGWRMFDFPGGRKIIYHNGWWHGNNAVLLRPFQDGATIILLGNKYNRNIYHARDLIGLFGHYGTVDSDE